MLKGDLLTYAEQTVLGSTFIDEIFRIPLLKPLFEEHQKGRHDHGMVIWNLLNLSLWHRYWIEGRSIGR